MPFPPRSCMNRYQSRDSGPAAALGRSKESSEGTQQCGTRSAVVSCSPTQPIGLSGTPPARNTRSEGRVWTGKEYVSRQARIVFAAPCAASRIALLGAGPVERMIVDFQLGRQAPPCPTRFFTSKVQAMAWLHDASDRSA
jgi:hypothetical protein